MAAPRVERARLAFDGRFLGLSQPVGRASLLTAPFVVARDVLRLALAVIALLAWRRVDAGQ
jgi:hypothetical protein